MRLSLFVLLRALALLLILWSIVTLGQGVERLLFISDYGLLFSGLIGPSIALALALALVAITSRLEAVHPIFDWLMSVGVAMTPVLIRPSESVLWLMVIVPLLLTRYGIEQIGARSKNELRMSAASVTAGLRSIILGLSLIISLGFGLITAEAITSGSLKLPPSLELQIERYLNSPTKLPVGELVAEQANKLGAYVPLTATLAYLTIFLFVVSPLLLQLSVWLTLSLRPLLRTIGWLKLQQREVRQEYAELE